MRDMDNKQNSDGDDNPVPNWLQAELTPQGKPIYICNYCRAEYDIENESLFNSECRHCKNQKIPLNMVDCPKCGRKYENNRAKWVCPYEDCRYDSKFNGGYS